MIDLAIKLKKCLRTLIDVRAKYIINEDRLKLNSDYKTHDLISVVYSEIAPEIVLSIYVALNLCNNNSPNPYNIGFFYTRMELPAHLKTINTAFANAINQEVVLSLSNDLDFYTRESFNALEKLETTI